MEHKPLELYIHIPFCVKKCQYCDFLSFGIQDLGVREQMGCSNMDQPVPDEYIDALCLEMEWYSQQQDYKQRPVVSIFFGGGTPSLMSEKQMEKVMSAIRTHFSLQDEAEITMEANPGTVTLEKLQMARQLGVNRLSMGLQSTNANELKLLGRIHTYEDFLQSYLWARESGFKNINVDLITAVPDQTENSYKKSLEQILALEPEHISAYSLIIEPGTPFEILEEEGKLSLPDEEEERRMYRLTQELLGKHGYDRYEISNYAKPGFECKHNIGYWQRKDYLGLGLGAASLIGNQRFTNTSDMSIYIEGIHSEKTWYSDRESLNIQSEMEEFMFLGLRMTSGVSEDEFEELFGKNIMSVYGDVINKYVENGLLKRSHRKICLTNAGLDLANQVMSDFLL